MTAIRPPLQRRIDARTQQRSADLDDDGILTQAHDLGAVAGSDLYAGFVALVLHALLLMVDAMPVLAKHGTRCPVATASSWKPPTA
ncbi:hypothetical protein ACH492_34420 [Streptomyces sp. NPDC019443]|uniref:hypothetical protein n=1 Tax=Streptomyces sp. NPDC019443 TaxID=3365061 RepID=UPI0037AC42B4